MKDNNRFKGFILLEVLLSLVILGTVLVVSIQAISDLARATSTSSNTNIAAALSQQLLARINLNEFKAGINEGKFENERTEFSWEINKTEVSDYESLYEIAVKWPECGIIKDIKLTTSRVEYKNGI